VSIGDLEGMLAHASAMLEPAERLRDNFWWTGALWHNEIGARLAGDWAAARDYSDRCLAISPDRYSIIADRMLLECEVGDFETAAAYFDRFLKITQHSPGLRGRTSVNAYLAMLIPLYSGFTGNLSYRSIAAQAADIVLSTPTANPNNISRARIGLGLIAVLKHDITAAQNLLPDLEEYKGNMLWWLISVDRLLGLLSHTIGDLDQAQGHFEDGLAFCRRAGFRPELAWTCHDYADSLLKRNSIGYREKAVSLLGESLAISTELGMRPLMERVVALQERAESQPARAPTYPDGLTQREVEVLRLISSGKTNRQIGEELFISLNTVGHHVSNILSKTGSANRAEVATYAAQHGLTP